MLEPTIDRIHGVRVAQFRSFISLETIANEVRASKVRILANPRIAPIADRLAMNDELDALYLALLSSVGEDSDRILSIPHGVFIASAPMLRQFIQSMKTGR